MLEYLTKSRRGFTLVEIMIVVAIIALLAAIAVPNFMRARKRSQATRILNDLRMVDAAIDQYAIENNKGALAPVAFLDLKKYLRAGTVLYETGPADLLGNDMTITNVDVIPKVSSTTFSQLSDVAPASFWSPYR